jgi:hypothetical protein
MKEPEKTVLWSADSVAPNQSSITLSDSIDNYDEVIFYGSGTRNYVPNVQTNYPVISGQVNLGGPFFVGKWGSGDTWLLCNGTQVYLSGTSGFVASSYYWGKTDGGTAYNASLVNNRANDIRPYKIVGVKYPKNYDRTLIWSATENEYGKNITLSEPVTHFKELEVRASGFETAAPGCHHAGKNIYNTQPRLMGCDAWAYSPWKVSDRHNLIIGNEMRVSGNSGFIGSGYFFGMGSNTTAWAAGKWTDWIEQALMPYELYGLQRKPVRKLTLIPPTAGGTQSASETSGYEYDQITMSNTPDEGWYFSGYNVTGATVNGNIITLQDQDASAQAGFTDEGFPITYQNDGHGTLTGDTNIGIPGQPINLTTSYNTYYRLSGYQVTGGYVEDGKLYATAACTAKAVYKPNAFTATGNYNFGGVTANSWNRTWNGIIRARTGSLPAGWGSNGSTFVPSNASAYKITSNTTIHAKCNRQLWVTATLQAGSTNIKTVTATNGNVSYGGNVSPNINTSTTTQGTPKIYFKATGYYTNKVSATSMSPNGWTATGYAP